MLYNQNYQTLLPFATSGMKNVIIAIFNHSYTTNPLFARNESNVPDGV